MTAGTSAARARGPRVDQDGNRFLVRGAWEQRAQVKVIPGARWSPDERAWALPRSPLTAAALIDALGIADPELVEMAEMAQVDRRTDPALDEPLPFDSPFGPRWAHQTRGSRWLAGHEAALLQYGLGTGKTRAALDALRLVGARTIVVLSPLRVCRTWEREAARHHPDEFRVVRLDADRGSVVRRVRALADEVRRAAMPGAAPMLVALNYEAAWRPAMATALLSLRPDVLILDEVHRIKGPAATQSKFAARLARVSARRWGLSGTPLAHSPQDAYAIFRALDPGVFGTSFGTFKARYCVMGGYGSYQVLGYRNMDEFRERYYALTLAASRDVLDLPAAMHETVEVELPADALRAHEQVKREAVTFLSDADGGAGGTREIVATNVLTRLLRMCQIASGHAGVDAAPEDEPATPAPEGAEQPPRRRASTAEVVEVHRAKQDALAELLGDLDPGEPVVVFCRFRHDVEQIRRASEAAGRLCLAVTGDRDDLDTWQGATGGEVLATNIQSGGEGVDLTRARYAVYYDLPFSLAQYVQSLARIHRPGQTRPVAYYYLVGRGTVDEYVRSTLGKRQSVIDRVLDERALDF